MITLITTCPFCGRENSINVREEDYSAWQDGALVQDAFPYLSADEREMLISGICPTCWNDTFSDEEEDEDFEPDYDECGFNTYIGCYDYDC